ncbi:MAG: glycosyltransferase family 4 protein [Burkholderiales bacterium]
MKILLAHCFYRSSSPSGEDVVFRNERALLEDHGNTVISLERFNDNIEDRSFASKISLSHETVWSRPSYDAVVTAIQKSKPDVAHFHNTFPQLSPSVYAACQDSGVPVVQTLHNFRLVCANGLLMRKGKPCEDCLSGGVINALIHRCYRNSLPATSVISWMQVKNRHQGVYHRQVNRYIALTQFSIPRFIEGGLPEYRIAVKPNFLPSPPAFSREKERYAVFVGRLTAEKGISTLLEAWKKLPDFALKIFGDGELRQELEKKLSRDKINAEFFGFRPRNEVLAAVSKASFQIIPSECYEGFPLALLEAYASGTAVLVSRLGGLDELVIDRETGRKFEAGNPDSLAKIAQQLISNPEQLTQLGRQAREEFDRKYTAERNYDQLMKIYHEAINDFHGKDVKESQA